MLVDAKREPECAVFKESDESVLCTPGTGKQVHCLGDDRLTDKKWRFQFFNTFDHPLVMPLGAVEKRNKRPRINDCDGHCGRIP